MVEETVEHEEINLQTIEDALYRHDTTDHPVEGKISIFSNLPSDRDQLVFGFWAHVPKGNGLVRVRFDPKEQELCQNLASEIIGLDPRIEKIVDKLDESSIHPKVEICNDDDDDKPILIHNGNPIYPADQYDRERGTY